MKKGLKIFITYAHKNSDAKDKLITYLAVLKQKGLIDVWHDNEILPGDKWRDEIFNNLADSDILLYLTCRYSLASENCNKELIAALSPNIKVIPIILEHCDWKNHQLSDFQALPDKGKPIYDFNEWNPESKGWLNVVEGIRKVANEMLSQAQPAIAVTPEEINILANWMRQKGNFMMMLKHFDEAIAAYSRAIELKPKNAGYYNDRGVAYGEKGDPELAINDFNTSIQYNPDNAETYYNRGVAYDMKNDVEHAFKNYTKTIQLNPKYANAYVNRGNAYNNKGRLTLAINDLKKAIRLNPNDAKAYTNLGKSYGKKGEYDRAINNFKKAIRRDPNLAEAYNNLGLSYLIKGNFKLAIKNFDKATQLNPEYANAYRNRCIVWLNLHKWDKLRYDLIKAQSVIDDIIIEFFSQYDSIVDFEQKHGVKIPLDIAKMLTPPQA